MRGWTLPKLPYDSFGTLQWVELMGMPTFEAISTVRALITSRQNPLWIDKDRRRQKTDREINETQNGATHCMTPSKQTPQKQRNLPQRQKGGEDAKFSLTLEAWSLGLRQAQGALVLFSRESESAALPQPRSCIQLCGTWLCSIDICVQLRRLAVIGNHFQAHGARIGTVLII